MTAPDYAGPQHAPWLTIAALIAAYVLIVISVWWGRHRRGDHAETAAVKHAQLMKEIRNYERDEREGLWDEAD